MRKKTIDTIPVLSDKIKKLLTLFSKSLSLPAHFVKRSQIILLASQGTTNQTIALETGLYYTNVATWRNRFLEAIPFLEDIEMKNPDGLEDEIKRLLSDEKRSGALSIYTPEQIVKIIDLACKNPNDFGHEVSHWSLSLLVDEIQKQKIADCISRKSVSRFLKMR